MSVDRITLRRPDDWHLHLRDGPMLEGIAGPSMQHVGRAIIMPNLVPPVISGDDARAYRDRILKALEGASAKSTRTGLPVMTLYLTETTDPDDVAAAAAEGLVQAVKLYPAGATTNSDSGVRNFEAVLPVLERMAEIGLPLCVHGEVTDPEIDIFDREAVFIERVLDPVRRRTPGLKVVMEHVTTKDAVDYVSSVPSDLGATVTPHHLMLNRNHLLVGGIRPHYYCLPIVKRERHRQALRRAATSGDARFFLGTDSAPHADHTKEAPCGCAGVFNAPNALSCLAHVFEEEGALDRLEAFASLNGAAFYGVALNDETITMVKGDKAVQYPDKIETGAGPVTVFDPGFPLFWRVA
ncbi:MAG: dihydroorotase [Alphaproteobacteria bacterium]|nr:dihydroorotase [Alphaproteobacteria bacterium]